MNTQLKYWIAAIALIVWLVLAWFTGSWLHLQGNSIWILRIALAFIGIAAFVIVVWWFWTKDKERAEMGAATGAAGDEIDSLIREAEMRLQSSQLGRGARIGSLPLYLIVGESGSAKTSVVLNSGLEAELLTGQTLQSNNLPTPTRTANIWYARQFIIAEAGGPLLQDRPKWIKLVKKLAPRQLHSVFGKGTPSPRGALVCVDCESFTKPGAAEAMTASIVRIQTRLREVSQLLGISLPVYVLFARADRLQFFHDYVRNFNNDQASVVFGTTLPLVAYSSGVYAEQETARLSSAFDNLFQSLADRRVNLLAQEFDSTKLPTIYEFPREFRKLRNLLVQLLVDVARPSQLRRGPFLRGFYFCGVRPVTVTTAGPSLAREQAAAQRDAAGDVQATGIFDMRRAREMAGQRPTQEVSETHRIPQWTFLPHLFSDVLLKDSSALVASASSTKTSLWRRVLLATATVVLVIFIIGFMISFVRNKSLESQVVTAAEGISEGQFTGQQLPSLDMLNRLETLRQSVETLSSYQEDGPPFSMRWGLYVGNSLYPDVRRAYFQHFQHILFGQAQANLVQTLAALPDAPGPSDPYGPPYDTLKAYLITTANHDKSMVSFLSPVLMKAWVAGREIDPDRQELAQKQFDFYSAQLKIENPYTSDYDTLQVSRARHYISQFSGGERVYRFVLAEADKANPSINFNKKFPGSADVVVDRSEVSGAFTKGGWSFMQDALQNLSKYFSGEQWVLGDQSTASLDITKVGADLRAQYQKDFIEQWRTFLRNGNVVKYNGLPDAAQKLMKLSGNQSPLLALFCVAAQNTAVGQPDVTNAFQAVQAVVSPNCQDQYIGPSNQPYIAGLSGLQGCLDRANNAPGDKDAAKAQCLNDASNAQQAARNMGQAFKIDQDGHIDQTVQNLLLAPITTIAAVLKPGPVSGQGLCAQMSALESRYPFNPQATLEATPQDLAAVFDPNSGALAQFYNAALKTLLLPQGTGYIANPSATQAVNPAFLTFFNRAAAIQRALYSGAPGQLQVKYALRPHPTESVTGMTMNIDGQTMSYSGGNTSTQNFTWPGVTGQGITLTVKMQGGSDVSFANYPGTWGVFHFFGDADKTVQNGSMYNVEWIGRGAGGHPMTTPNGKTVIVQFDLDTLGSAPVLQKGFFSSLRCVSSVAK